MEHIFNSFHHAGIYDAFMGNFYRCVKEISQNKQVYLLTAIPDSGRSHSRL